MGDPSRSEVPKKMQPVYEAVTEWTESFCKATLSDEYATLAHEMAAALSRKRPSPLLQGSAKIWASGIVLALGRVNFLFDPERKPHLTIASFCDLFGVSQSAAFAKARQVEQALKIIPMDPRWTLPTQLEDNPFAWFLAVNGVVVDVQDAPEGNSGEGFQRRLDSLCSFRSNKGDQEAQVKHGHPDVSRLSLFFIAGKVHLEFSGILPWKISGRPREGFSLPSISSRTRVTVQEVISTKKS